MGNCVIIKSRTSFMQIYLPEIFFFFQNLITVDIRTIKFGKVKCQNFFTYNTKLVAKFDLTNCLQIKIQNVMDYSHYSPCFVLFCFVLFCLSGFFFADFNIFLIISQNDTHCITHLMLSLLSSEGGVKKT